MIEFLIRRTDGEWFDLAEERCAAVFHPNTLPYEAVPGWGTVRIRSAGTEVSVSAEDPGYQVSFEGTIEVAVARRIVEEMLENLERETGQQGRIVEI